MRVRFMRSKLNILFKHVLRFNNTLDVFPADEISNYQMSATKVSLFVVIINSLLKCLSFTEAFTDTLSYL